MKRMNYGSKKEKASLSAAYQAAFDGFIERNSDQWDDWREKLKMADAFPKEEDIKDMSLEELLVADFHKLARIFVAFAKGKDAQDSADTDELKAMFDYENKYGQGIRDFFQKHSKELEISTCYYCDMAYVNTYEDDTTDRHRRRTHFDLDHVLNKAECPIVALSLFNFVPSCQICNQRLKREWVLGYNDRNSDPDRPVNELVDDICRHSPTCEAYDFETRATFYVDGEIGELSRLEHPENYHLRIRSDEQYRKEVEFFKLDQRYDFHKVEALQLLDKKDRYPDEHLKEVSIHCGGIPIEQIKDDLFQKEFHTKHHRTFSKLYRDILGDD